jgi:hypothetical protein
VESELIWWTGLAPWKFEFPFPGILTPTLILQIEKYDAWTKTYATWKGANADKAALLEKFQKKEVMSAADMFKNIPAFDQVPPPPPTDRDHQL